MAMREIRQAGFDTGQLPGLAAQMAAALAPVQTEWLMQRLGVMWLAMGHSKDGDVATAWLHETTRLLSDLPQDICSEAIDEAVKASTKGFMPAIGEIRKIADPMLAKRMRATHRLNALVNWKAEKPQEVETVKPEEMINILEQTGFGDVAAKLAGKAKGAERPPLRVPTAEDYAAMGYPQGTGDTA